MRFLHCNFRYVCLEGSYGRHPSVSAQPGYGPNQPVGNHTYGNNMPMGYSRMNQSVYPQHYGHQQNSGHVPVLLEWFMSSMMTQMLFSTGTE